MIQISNGKKTYLQMITFQKNMYAILKGVRIAILKGVRVTYTQCVLPAENLIKDTDFQQ